MFSCTQQRETNSYNEYTTSNPTSKINLDYYSEFEHKFTSTINKINLKNLIKEIFFHTKEMTINLEILKYILSKYYTEEENINSILKWIRNSFFTIGKIDNKKEDLKNQYTIYKNFNTNLFILEYTNKFSFLSIDKMNLNNKKSNSNFKIFDPISIIFFFLIFTKTDMKIKSEILFEILDYQNKGIICSSYKSFSIILRKFLIVHLFMTDCCLNNYIEKEIPYNLKESFERNKLFTTIENNYEELKTLHNFNQFVFLYKKFLFFLKETSGMMKDFTNFVSHNLIFYERISSQKIDKNKFVDLLMNKNYNIFNSNFMRDYLIQFMKMNSEKTNFLLEQMKILIKTTEKKLSRGKYEPINEKFFMQKANELNMNKDLNKYKEIFQNEEIFKILLNRDFDLMRKNVELSQNEFNSKKTIKKGSTLKLELKNDSEIINQEIKKQNILFLTNLKYKKSNRNLIVDKLYDEVEDDLNNNFKNSTPSSSDEGTPEKSSKKLTNNYNKLSNKISPFNLKNKFKFVGNLDIVQENQNEDALHKLTEESDKKQIIRKSNFVKKLNENTNSLRKTILDKSADDKSFTVSIDKSNDNINKEKNNFNIDNSIINNLSQNKIKKEEDKLSNLENFEKEKSKLYKSDIIIENNSYIKNTNNISHNNIHSSSNNKIKKEIETIMTVTNDNYKSEIIEYNYGTTETNKLEEIKLDKEEFDDILDQNKLDDDFDNIRIITGNKINRGTENDENSEIDLDNTEKNYIKIYENNYDENNKENKFNDKISVRSSNSNSHSKENKLFEMKMIKVNTLPNETINKNTYSEINIKDEINSPNSKISKSSKMLKLQNEELNEYNKSIKNSLIEQTKKDSKVNNIFKTKLSDIKDYSGIIEDENFNSDADSMIEFFDNKNGMKMNTERNTELNSSILFKDDKEYVRETLNSNQRFTVNSYSVVNNRNNKENFINQNYIKEVKENEDEIEENQEKTNINIIKKSHTNFNIDFDKFYESFFSKFSEIQYLNYDKNLIKLIEIYENKISNLINLYPDLNLCLKQEIFNIHEGKISPQAINLYLNILNEYNKFLVNKKLLKTQVKFVDTNFFTKLQEVFINDKEYTKLIYEYKNILFEGDQNIFYSNIQNENINSNILIIPIYLENQVETQNKYLFFAKIEFNTKKIILYDSCDILFQDQMIISNYKIIFETFFEFLTFNGIIAKNSQNWKIEVDCNCTCYEMEEDTPIVNLLHCAELFCKDEEIDFDEEVNYTEWREIIFLQISQFYINLFNLN